MAERVKTTCYFDGHSLGRHQKFFLVIAALTYAFDLMDMSIFAIVAPILNSQYGLSNEKIATLSFLFFIGMFVGSVCGGALSDKIGRKKSLIACITIFSLASLASAVWQPHYFMMLEVTRFLTGFGTMAACSIAIAYISEMLPSEKRGKYQSITLGVGTFSIPFISIVASQIATRSAMGWRYIFAIGGAMIILVPFAMKFLSESPRYLISKGRVAEAEAVMQDCLGFACDMSEAYELYKQSVAQYHKISFGTQMKIMFSKKQARQTLVCLIFAICLGCGNNMMSNYNNVFLVQMGLPIAAILLAGAISSFGQPLGELISALFSDKGGRTIPIFFYCLVAGMLCIAMGFIHSATSYAILQFIKTLFTAGAMALLMTYIPESFPTSVRGSATGYIYGIQKIFISTSAFFTLLSWNKGGWMGCMIVNAAFWIVAAFVILLFGNRTALRNIDAMDMDEADAPC